MANPKEGADAPDYAPDFELSHHGVIREDNWPQYKAKGFMPLSGDASSPRSLWYAQVHYGVQHVYTGDAYDDEAERPLRHKPGLGLYVDPEGLAYGAENDRKWEERHRTPSAE